MKCTIKRKESEAKYRHRVVGAGRGKGSYKRFKSNHLKWIKIDLNDRENVVF